MDLHRMTGQPNYLFPEQGTPKPNMWPYYLQMANRMNYLDSVQRIYPEAYKRMLPYADRAAETVDDPSVLTETDMARFTHDIVHKSSILNDPPEGHNETTLKDLAGVMLLALLIDATEMHYPLPPYLPPYYMPYGRRFRGRTHGLLY